MSFKTAKYRSKTENIIQFFGQKDEKKSFISWVSFTDTKATIGQQES